MGTSAVPLVSMIWSRISLTSSKVLASVTEYTKMNASADEIDNALMAGNSYDPDVSKISNVRWTPVTLNSAWCISSMVRLYFSEKVLYKNWDINDVLPTLAAPITTILCLLAVLQFDPSDSSLMPESDWLSERLQHIQKHQSLLNSSYCFYSKLMRAAIKFNHFWIPAKTI